MTRQMILSIVTAALLSIPLVADDAPAPLLFIERIEVRNAKRVSRDVVVAESRLREGHEYSEAELRDASTRLSRLPFLLSVDFALEKGTDRGRHVLVLTINETRPFFFLVDAQANYNDEDNSLDTDFNGRSSSGDTLALGYRRFVGRRGAVHVGLAVSGQERERAKDYTSLAIGYTQYDLFGTRAFATLNLKKPFEGYGGGISPQLVVGVPLSANQTLTLQYDETRFAGQTRILAGQEYSSKSENRLVTARWSYNTTNEPFFPTRGTLLHVTPGIGASDSGGAFLARSDGTFEVTTIHSDRYGAEAGATRYWELSERDSVWGDLRGEWARIDQRSTTREVDSGAITVRYGAAGIGYSRSLWSRERRANGGDSRVELTARYSNLTRDYGQFTNYVGYSRDLRRLDAAWLRRTSWGTLRLGAGYAW